MPDPSSERHKRILFHLQAGFTPKEVAIGEGLTPDAIYYVARKHDAPTNCMPCYRGGKWRQIRQKAAEGFTPEELGRLFRLAIPIVRHIIKDLPPNQWEP